MKRVLFIITLVSALFFLAFAREKGSISHDVTDSFSSTEKLDAERDEDISIQSNGDESYTGYAYSRKVLSNGTGLSFANMVKEANTIYEIRDAFDLNGKTVTIPDNCVLRFEGGTLKNGTIVGNNTVLEGPATSILNKTLDFKEVDKFHIDGIYFPKGKDISVLAQRMLDVFNYLELKTGTYYLSTPLILKGYYTKIKGAGKRTVLTTKGKLDYAIRTAFDNEVQKPGKYYNASFIEISDIMIDGGTSKRFKNGIFLDGPSCTVSNCFVTNILSVGVKLSEWCNNLNYCTITHCDIGALIIRRANAVNICSNRIESNKVNLVVQGYRGVNIRDNTLEGGDLFNIVVGSGYNCNIKDNYFEGYASSVTSILTTTEGRSLTFTGGGRKLMGLLWIGSVEIKENNSITGISYKIGEKEAPTTVTIEGNYVDIHRVDDSTEPETYFAIIGSCKDYCTIQKNTFTHVQNAICAFFDTDNAILGNTEILDNYVAGTTKTNNSLDLIHDKYSKAGWRAKKHVVGKLQLDSNE